MNQLLSYWQTQSGLLLDQVALIRQRPSRRAVHDARVAVKKMKALLKLANELSTDHERFCLPPSLQLIFGTAGRYRETEMALLLLRSVHKKEAILLPSFIKEQKARLTINRKNLRLSVLADVETAIAEISVMLEELINTDDTALNESIHRLSAELVTELKDRMKEFPKKAHACRKKSKQLYYWLQICTLNTMYDPVEMKVLHKALDALGQWHDTEVLRQRIRRFRKTCLVKGMEEEDACRKAEEWLDIKMEEWLFNAREKLELLLNAK